MLMVIDNTLQLYHAHNFTMISACALEVAAYISDHGNWPHPILPEESECSAMTFDPERFDFGSFAWVFSGGIQQGK